jgi:hypothetical protein
MSSWEQWQAAQGSPPTQAPTAARNQNILPSNNDNPNQGAAVAASAQSARPHGGPQSQPPPPLNQASKPATGGEEGMRILSADEVKKELNAMDPDTRQKTIEMGNKLKDIVQAAIDIYTVTPNLSSSLFKEKILERVGPMPVKEIDLPIHALKALYNKLYGKNVPPEHEAPLQALSKVFSPQQHQQQQGAPGEVKQEEEGKLAAPGGGDTLDNKEVSTAAMMTNKAGVISTATGAAAGGAAIGGGGGKKLGVSREQYEKLLSKMNPEERKKHPKYDQVMKQYEQ